MEQLLYERPREKMQRIGVRSLQMTELLQVIIGSGSRGYPVTRLAKKVARVIEARTSINIESELRSIPGIGAASAARLIAVVELAHRLERPVLEGPLDEWLKGVGMARQLTLRWCLVDGAGDTVSRHEYVPKKAEHYMFSVRQVLRQVLRENVASFVVAVGGRHESIDLTLGTRGLIRSLYEQSAALQVCMKGSFVIVNEIQREVFKREIAT